MPATAPAGTFHDFMEQARRAGTLVVQPRMGFGAVERMRAGLIATKNADATSVGTVTLDSYTRVGDFTAAERALREGGDLNGYPIATLGPDATRAMLDGVRDAGFPVQVRHGSAVPGPIFDALMAAGLDATEGGPISYCLPYSRTPVNRSVDAWREVCRRFAGLAETGGLHLMRNNYPRARCWVKLPPARDVADAAAVAWQAGADAVTVDGAEGGTGWAPGVFLDQVGLPLHECLRRLGRPSGTLLASGRVHDGARTLKLLALGALVARTRAEGLLGGARPWSG